MRELIVRVLAREGYAVRPLPRGQEALQALEEGPVDLVVSDIRMPEMDGLTLLQEVRRLAPETSVLMMTAFGSIDTAVQEMTARVAEIAAAAGQITTDAERMQTEIADVAAVAEESSASAEQVSASTQETSASTQEIASSASELATTAEDLSRLVAHFRLVA